MEPEYNIFKTKVQDLLEIHQTLTLSELKPTREIRTVVENVEILPPEMIFADAYEGKEFSKKICLHNIGKNSVYVRIEAPTANAFALQSSPRVCHLSPGLRICCTIKFKYTRTMSVLNATMNIVINHTVVNYMLRVTLNKSNLVLEPEEVNFGRIDALRSMVTRQVVVKNIGSRNCNFAIDLGRNELELIVEPTRGLIEASQSVTLNLEVMGFYEGPFIKEFWIKATPPKRVKVIGEFLIPKIISPYPKAYSDFSMIYFDRLYIGQKCTKILMIKNNSSTAIMFCVMAVDQELNYLPYEKAGEINDSFKCFKIIPLEGPLGSHQTTVIQIIFEPKKINVNHAVCFIQVLRIDCSDVDESVVVRINPENEIDNLRNADQTRSTHSIGASIPEIDIDVNENLKEENLVTEKRIARYDSFRVCLYGEMQTANIKITPSTVFLNKIMLNQVYYRELLIENCSHYLPISVRYLKISNVNMEPENLSLNPKESRNVLLAIKATRAGPFDAKTYLEMTTFRDECLKKDLVVVGSQELHISFTGIQHQKTPPTKFNQGIDPKNIHEVGFLVDNVRFNTHVTKPRTAVISQNRKIFNDNDDALIAFPNDRPRSLRPWKTLTPCLTIFKQMPRCIVTHDEYGWSPSKTDLRNKNKLFYQNFINSLKKESSKKYNKEVIAKKTAISEKLKLMLFKKYSCDMEPGENNKIYKARVRNFVPLSPLDLYKIKISPKYIRLKKVAPNSSVSHNFTISNGNPFPVLVYLTSLKTGITFSDGDWHVINSEEEKRFQLECAAGIVGRYINTIQIVLNFCHLYTISVMVQVVPKLVNLYENGIVFEPGGPDIKYLELKNDLNSELFFSWSIPFSRYQIYPSSGHIPQNRTMMCCLQYKPSPDTPDHTELTLTSEAGGRQIIPISRKKKTPLVSLIPNKLDFDLVPLNVNVSQKIVIQNHADYSVCFIVTEPIPIVGLEILPYEGVINPFGQVVLTASVEIKNVTAINTKFEFVFENNLYVDLPVSGTVIYPKLEILPDHILNRKLLPFSYKINAFRVKNVSLCDCYIKFDLEDFLELTVTSSENINDVLTKDDIKLEPGEVKALFLHTHPLESQVDSFYLPMVINNILGPAIITDKQTLNPLYFMPGSDDSVVLPLKLPLIHIKCIIRAMSVHFSSLNLVFDETSDIQSVTISNQGKEPLDLCLRTDELDEAAPFAMSPHLENSVQENPKSYVCHLEPSEEIGFSVALKVKSPGKYEVKVPIFIRDYANGEMFNRMIFSAIIPEASITIKHDIYYFEPTPLNVRNNIRITLSLANHKNNCKLSYSYTSVDTSVIFLEEPLAEKTHVKVKIVYNSRDVEAFQTAVRFHCTCGASKSISVKGCTDNSILTHHVFIQLHKNYFFNLLNTSSTIFGSNPVASSSLSVLKFIEVDDLEERPEVENIDNENQYPYFSSLRDATIVGQQLNQTLKAVEYWLFTQGYYRTRFLNIPDVISLVPRQPENKDSKNTPKKSKADNKKPSIIEPYIVEFLVNLAGPQVRVEIIKCKPVDENSLLDLALHFYKIYANILQFLRKNGALLPHVQPEYLLNYDQYKIMCTYQPEELLCLKPYAERKYQKLSTQCYLDVILQSIRIFILFRVEPFESIYDKEQQISSVCSLQPKVLQPFVYSKILTTGKIMTKHEEILLYWLEYHYEKNKQALWKVSKDLSQKNVKMFDDVFQDSLLFAAVTAAYCPYISWAVKDMFIPAESIEELYHNAGKLLEAWKLLQLSYYVEPTDLVKPNSVNMLLLTLYLFDVLPGFYPSQSLTMKSKLTETSTAPISIQNISGHAAVYTILFFKNKYDCFSTKSNTLRINPKATGLLQIAYRAKKVTKQKATVVLSGEKMGQKYAKSIAIKIVGIPDIDHATKVVELKADIYRIYHMTIPLHTPYDVPDTYQLFYKIMEVGAKPENLDTQLYSWKKYVDTNVPKRVYSKEYSLSITDLETGCVFSPIVCCHLTTKKVYTIYLIGEHGDWCFKLVTLPKVLKKNYEVINVSLPRGFREQVCVCRKPGDILPICPRTIILSIPCKNNLLWKAFKDVFIACLGAQDFAFWKKFLPHRATTNLMHALFKMDKSVRNLRDYIELFKKTVTFKVKPDAKAPFTSEAILTIEDIRSESNKELSIHVNQEFETTGENSFLQMDTVSGIEVRFYKLNFYEER